MKSIGTMLELPKRLEELRIQREKEILADIDIKQFIKENEDFLSEEDINNSMTTFNEYIITRDNDRYYYPELVIYSNIVVCNKIQRDQELIKYNKEVLKEFKYDENTRNYAEISMKDYKSSGIGALKAEQFIRNFIDNYQYGKKIKGMWLCGERGVGKSYLLGTFTKTLKAKNIGFRYMGAQQIHESLIESQRAYNKTLNKELYGYKRTEVLIIDDIGKEKPTDFMINQVLYSIMNYRMYNNMPTFFTSNYTKYDYFEHLKQLGINPMDVKQLESRIDALVSEVQMQGANRRVKA